MQVVEGNPVIEYCLHIVLPHDGKLCVARSDANGGPVTYTHGDDLRRDYSSGNLHPGVQTRCGSCRCRCCVSAWGGQGVGEPGVRMLMVLQTACPHACA